MKPKTTLLILFQQLVILVVLSLDVCGHSHTKASTFYTNDGPAKLIVTSFDGFRPDYVDRKRTPNLYRIKVEGTSAKNIKSCFGTKTYPNHMSIATGLYEETHGIVHNIMYDPLYNISFVNYSTDKRWWTESEALPLWTANELQNDGKERSSGVVMWPGGDVAYRDKLPRYLLPFKSNANWTSNVDYIISWLTNDTHPVNCIFMYIDQPDDTAHSYGPWATQTLDQVSRIDQLVGYFVDRLKKVNLYDQVNLIFISDHGMAEVPDTQIIQLNEFIDPSTYSMYGKSPLWNISPKPGKENYVYDILREESKNRNFSVYKRQSVPFEYHYSKHRRILDLVIIADEGWDIIDDKRNLDEVQSRVYGNHGYNNSLESMKPLFIARGPNFQSNFEVEEEFENIDLYPMMSMLLQLLPIHPTNGSLHVTHKILKPIYRSSHPENYFSFLTPIILGSALIVASGCCFVLCMSCGKPRKRLDLTWDINSSDFDFGEDYADGNSGRNFKFLTRFTSVPESVLLLDDIDEEDETESKLNQT